MDKLHLVILIAGKGGLPGDIDPPPLRPILALVDYSPLTGTDTPIRTQSCPLWCFSQFQFSECQRWRTGSSFYLGTSLST